MNKRKLWCLVVLACLVGSLLVGCGGGKFIEYISGSRGEDTEVTELRTRLVEEIRTETSAENYRAHEQNIYLHAVLDAENELNECESVADLQAVYDKHIALIAAIKTDLQYVREEALTAVDTYVDKTNYRAEQRREIEMLLNAAHTQIEQAQDKQTIDTAYRAYISAAYLLPTEQALYACELADLKRDLQMALDAMYEVSAYRAEQAEVVRQTIAQFADAVADLQSKESVLMQYAAAIETLGKIETDIVLREKERKQLLRELRITMTETVCEYFVGNEQEMYLHKADEVYTQMQGLRSNVAMQETCYTFLSEFFAPASRRLITLYNSETMYRQAESEEIKQIKETYVARITDQTTATVAKEVLQEAKDKIDRVKTNDDLWNESVQQFRVDLANKYGNAVLNEPRSLTEANSYTELARIIDYYAFYQESATKFVCDTFRVKLRFDHSNDAHKETVAVYWYCELIRTGSKIDGTFEGEDDFVIHLTPYDIASRKNTRGEIDRLESAVTFEATENTTARDETFTDFPYKRYSRSVQVWNSQQLWYALEHEYVPVCAVGSSAEKCLKRAEEILREIIREGMTEEEKIFQIYTWIGQHGKFDYDGNGIKFINDQYVAELRSYHIDGLLLDNFAVCFGCAKTNTLLLRMEGIETYFTYGCGTISDFMYNVHVGHGFNYIHLNDNWYTGDSLRSFYETPGHNGISYRFLLLPAKGYAERYLGHLTHVQSYLWDRIDAEGTIDWSIYKKLRICGESAYVETAVQAGEVLSVVMGQNPQSFCILCPRAIADAVSAQITNYNIQRGNYDDMVEFYCYK